VHCTGSSALANVQIKARHVEKQPGCVLQADSGLRLFMVLSYLLLLRPWGCLSNTAMVAVAMELCVALASHKSA